MRTSHDGIGRGITLGILAVVIVIALAAYAVYNYEQNSIPANIRTEHDVLGGVAYEHGMVSGSCTLHFGTVSYSITTTISISLSPSTGSFHTTTTVIDSYVIDSTITSYETVNDSSNPSLTGCPTLT